MIHRPFDDVLQLHIGDEFCFLDELTSDMTYTTIVHLEEVAPRVAFAYLASYNDKDNDKNDIGTPYKYIAVFDDIPNEVNGIYRDPIIGRFGKYSGQE